MIPTAAAGISETAALGQPLAAANVAAIKEALQSIRPNSKLKKWTIRVQQIAAVVASDGDVITPEESKDFLRVLEL